MPKIAVLVVVLLLGISHLAQLSGRVLDRTGKPIPNARVIYTNVDTGKTYKFKTNKKGEFSGLGVEQGVYQIEITAQDGASLYKTKRNIVDPNTENFKKDTNFLNADLSVLSVTNLPGGIKANVLSKEPTAQQKEMIRANNANVEKMNELIRSLHAAIDAREWPAATDILNQLIAADPNRWEFYQNLGTVQTSQSKYEEAAKSYERGIELVQSGVTTGRQPDKSDISLMMIYAGDANARAGNLDKAIELYTKAAEISQDPATAYFNICRAQRTTGNVDAATQACKKAIAADPNRWEFYQLLGSLEQNAGHDQLAIDDYEKGIQAAEKSIPTSLNANQAKVGMGQMLSAEGNLYVHMKKFDPAIEVFTRAVEYAAYPPREYFNICAAYYDTDRMDAAIDACNKAIGSDPRMADAYFVKASALFGKSKAERGKLVVPPGTQEALNKYLELDPQGPHAADAREMLAKIGSPVDTNFKSQHK
ncbi:MAG TPA: tetratricopeptide repeat protein [Candidatus Angelobacter sp.]